MGDKFVGGVRIHFDGTGGIPCQKLVEVPNRPYKLPLLCGQCGVFHMVKTYHLELDADGNQIVSREIAEQLRMAGVEFDVLNVVRQPPKIRLNMGGMGSVFRVVEKAVT